MAAIMLSPGSEPPPLSVMAAAAVMAARVLSSDPPVLSVRVTGDRYMLMSAPLLAAVDCRGLLHDSSIGGVAGMEDDRFVLAVQGKVRVRIRYGANETGNAVPRVGTKPGHHACCQRELGMSQGISRVGVGNDSEEPQDCSRFAAASRKVVGQGNDKSCHHGHCIQNERTVGCLKNHKIICSNHIVRNPAGGRIVAGICRNGYVGLATRSSSRQGSLVQRSHDREGVSRSQIRVNETG